MTGGEETCENRHPSRRSSVSSVSSISSISTTPDPPTTDNIPPETPIYGTARLSGPPHEPTEYRQGGLRRRPSNAPRDPPLHEFVRPDLFEQPSRRRIHASSDSIRKDEHFSNHPDSGDRSRPPRSNRNVEGWNQDNAPISRPNFDDNRVDLEQGVDRCQRHCECHSSSDASTDSYFYDSQRKSKYNCLSPEEKEALRIPGLRWMQSSSKNHLLAAIGEFVGTTMFLFFAFAGSQVATLRARSGTDQDDSDSSPPFDISVYLYISIISGFSLMVNVWIFYRISGGLFNPAITLGMVLVGAISIVRAVCLFLAQILGGIAASALVLGLFPTPLNVRTSLGPGTSQVQGFFIEAILTAELVFTVFMLAKEKHRATFLAPIGIGLAVFIAQLVGLYYTGSSLNPARSFGPCVITATFEDEHWIYWVGPSFGALIAVAFYKLIKILEYEMVNPGQDGDDSNDPTKNESKLKEILKRREESFG